MPALITSIIPRVHVAVPAAWTRLSFPATCFSMNGGPTGPHPARQNSRGKSRVARLGPRPVGRVLPYSRQESMAPQAVSK
jgi:hypothetical protein